MIILNIRVGKSRRRVNGETKLCFAVRKDLEIDEHLWSEQVMCRRGMSNTTKTQDDDAMKGKNNSLVDKILMRAREIVLHSLECCISEYANINIVGILALYDRYLLILNCIEYNLSHLFSMYLLFPGMYQQCISIGKKVFGCPKAEFLSVFHFGIMFIEMTKNIIYSAHARILRG